MPLAEERAEQVRLIRDSAAAIVPRGAEGAVDLGRVRALRFGLPGFDRAIWQQMATLGWLGLRVPEAAGGAGLGLAELCALAEELGAGLVPEPLLALGLPAALLLAGADRREAAGPELARLLDGSRILAPAWAEGPASLEVSVADTLAEPAGGGARISGRKLFVPMAAGAEAFLVSARGPDGLGLWLVPAGAAGMRLSTETTIDGGHVGTLALEGVALGPEARLASPAVAPALLARALDEAVLATAAELLGLMDRAFALTLAYLKTRVQFGKPIGSFQALQHRAADLLVQVELTRAAVSHAATVLDDEASTPPTRAAAASQAKARAAEAALMVTRQAIQLHGAIGYTDEYDAGLYLRRAMVLSARYGTAAAHRGRYAATAPAATDHED